MAENEGSEKTERATPKRLEEARKKGQVPRSADLSAAIVSLIGAGFLYLFGAGAANEMLSVMRDGLSVTSVDLMQSDVLLRHTADQFVYGFLAVVPGSDKPVKSAAPATSAGPVVEPSPSGRSEQERYLEGMKVATQITSALGLRGFRLNLAVEAAGNLKKLLELLPKIEATAGTEACKALHAALKG